MEKILEKLISFNTVKDKENDKINNYLKDYFVSLGFNIEYDDKALVFSIGDNHSLGFICHTDTVSSGDKWTYNPFKLTKKKDKLYGLGSSDMKGGIAALLKVIGEINLSELKSGFKIIFTYDEEISFGGIKKIALSNVKVPDLVIVPEPTSNIPATKSKGLLEYEIEIFGDKRHSSIPLKNSSSNEKAVLFLNDVLKLNKKFKRKKYKDFEYIHNSLNIGVLDGGDDINTISDYTKILISFRICENKKDITYIKKYIDKLKNKYDRVNIKIINEINPVSSSKYKDMIEDITKVKSTSFFGITDASNIENVNAIILGPGPNNAHKIDEFVSKKEMEESKEIYKKIIRRICI